MSTKCLQAVLKVQKQMTYMHLFSRHTAALSTPRTTWKPGQPERGARPVQVDLRRPLRVRVSQPQLPWCPFPSRPLPQGTGQCGRSVSDESMAWLTGHSRVL